MIEIINKAEELVSDLRKLHTVHELEKANYRIDIKRLARILVEVLDEPDNMSLVGNAMALLSEIKPFED